MTNSGWARGCVAGALAALCAVSGAVAQAASSQDYAPEVTVQTRDYPGVRAGFRTHLLLAGPAPQNDPLAAPPAGVDQVTFPSGNLLLHGWIAGERDGGAALPAVLFLHGGFGFGEADWEMALPYWEAGYVLMTPMLRGENGQPGSFSFFYDEVADVLAAAQYLATLPGVDSTRIYLAGHSAGGTLALLTSEATRRFRAVASFDASPDQQLLYAGRASRPGRHAEVVFDTADPRELQVRSPLAYIGSLRTPARFYYSAQAASLFGQGTRRMAALAQAGGTDAAAVAVEGTHISHVAAAMEQSIAFFNQHGGVPASGTLPRRSVPQPPAGVAGNTTFALAGFEHARLVTLAGSFNRWDPKALRFVREDGRWVCHIDLRPGRYLYKFVVDGEWMVDPANPVTEADGAGNTNSVLVRQE